MVKSKVIVISGVTAGGKTTFIREFSQKIESCYVISFDDYSIDALPSAPSFDFFLENAKDAINQYDISLLMNDLLRVKEQYHTILIDFPFGYEHDTLKPFIDKVIYLKTPLDIAFARQIIRDYSDKDKDAILNWTKGYLNDARKLFLEHEKVISAIADYILDGTLDLDRQVEEINKLLVDNKLDEYIFLKEGSQ